MSRKERQFQVITREIRNFAKIIISEKFFVSKKIVSEGTQIIRQETLPYSRGCEYRKTCTRNEMNSPQEFRKILGKEILTNISCIRTPANADPACVRTKINSPRTFSCMYWFRADG